MLTQITVPLYITLMIKEESDSGILITRTDRKLSLGVKGRPRLAWDILIFGIVLCPFAVVGIHEIERSFNYQNLDLIKIGVPLLIVSWTLINIYLALTGEDYLILTDNDLTLLRRALWKSKSESYSIHELSGFHLYRQMGKGGGGWSIHFRVNGRERAWGYGVPYEKLKKVLDCLPSNLIDQ